MIFLEGFFNIFPKKEGHLEGFWPFSEKRRFWKVFCKKEGFYFCFSPNSRDNFSAYLVSLNKIIIILTPQQYCIMFYLTENTIDNVCLMCNV